jgi:hypothetical protein
VVVQPCAVSLTVGELEKLFETGAPPKAMLAALDLVALREDVPVQIPAPRLPSWRSRVQKGRRRLSTVVKVVALAGAVAALAYRVSC